MKTFSEICELNAMYRRAFSILDVGNLDFDEDSDFLTIDMACEHVFSYRRLSTASDAEIDAWHDREELERKIGKSSQKSRNRKGI